MTCKENDAHDWCAIWDKWPNYAALLCVALGLRYYHFAVLVLQVVVVK